MATAEELQGAIKGMATGMLKGNTADTLGAPVDIVNTMIRPVTERLGIATDTPFGGSAHMRSLFGMDIQDKNAAETAGSMISVGGAAKAAITAVTNAPAIIKTGLATATALVGGQEAIRAVGNSVQQRAVEAGRKLPQSQQGMVVGAARLGDIPGSGVEVAKYIDLSINHPEINKASKYNVTGVYGDPGEALKAVISDKDAKLGRLPPELRVPFKLSDVLDHPELFKLYPELKNVDVIRDITKKSGSASYQPAAGKGDNPTIRLSSQDVADANAHAPYSNPIALATIAKVKSTLLHETQHAVQNIEGFARGGSPAEFLPPNIDAQAKAVQAAVIRGRQSADPAVKEAAERFKDRFNAKTRDAHIKYENIKGEQEARFTQQTADYDQNQLAREVRAQLKAGVTPQSWDTQQLPSKIPAGTGGSVAPPAAQETSVLDLIRNAISNPK